MMTIPTIPQNIISSYEVKFKQIPKIEIINNSFKYAEEEYNLILINIIANKNLLIEKYFLFKNGKFFKKVICKKWIYTNRLSQEANKEQFIMLLDEIQNHIFIENSNIKYDSKILYYFFDNNQIGIFFEFLGDTLSKFNLSRVTIRNKIIMIIDFLEQCITLHNHNIYHSDIKPINICVNSRNVSNIESEKIIIHRLKLIDYGIAYSEFEYIHNKPYDTTISSASPEYLKIQLYDKNNNFPKELFDYSEHYAIAGIILGVFLNKPSFLFNISCKLMLKHADVTSHDYFEACHINDRFKSFTEEFSIELQNIISDKIDSLDESIFWIKPIILNMLEYDYKNRKSLEDIKIFFEKFLEI